MRARCLLFVGLIGLTSVAHAATVSISPSASTVAEAGSITFTITVTPSTYVQKVILTYEGESGQDEDMSSPYAITHQFNAPLDNLTVTATVKYTNSDPDDHTTVDINVVGLSISGSATPLRAWSTAYTAQSNPAGKAIDQFNWTYEWSGGSNTYQDNDANADDKSVWTGPMVVDGTLRCTATVSGVTVEKTKSVTVTARTWTIAITCAQDNEAGWGDTTYPETELGEHRDKDSDYRGYYFVPRSGNDFTTARTVVQVSTGPCNGWWYVSSSTLKCQRETVINHNIKSGGSFYSANTTADCFDTSPADFLQAIKNHEYRGTPDTFKSPEGHHGRTEKAIRDDGYDAKQHIEPLANRVKADLEDSINDVILADEIDVDAYAADENEFTVTGPNWGDDAGSLGSGENSRWDGSAWTQCVYGPDNF